MIFDLCFNVSSSEKQGVRFFCGSDFLKFFQMGLQQCCQDDTKNCFFLGGERRVSSELVTRQVQKSFFSQGCQQPGNQGKIVLFGETRGNSGKFVKIWIDWENSGRNFWCINIFYRFMPTYFKNFSNHIGKFKGFSSHFMPVYFKNISKISPIMVENSSAFLVLLYQHVSKFSAIMVDILGAFLVIFGPLRYVHHF